VLLVPKPFTGGQIARALDQLLSAAPPTKTEETVRP